MAESGKVGVAITSDEVAVLFGEDQARYLIACNFDQAEALMVAAGQADVTLNAVGRFEGTDVVFGKHTAPLAELRAAFRAGLADLFH